MKSYVEIPIAYAGPAIKLDLRDDDLVKYGWTGMVKYLLDKLVFNLYRLHDESRIVIEKNSITFIWNKEALYKIDNSITSLLISYLHTRLDDLNLGVNTDIKVELKDERIYIKISIDELSDREALLGLLRLKSITLTLEELKNWFMSCYGINNLNHTFYSCTNLSSISFPFLSSFSSKNHKKVM